MGARLYVETNYLLGVATGRYELDALLAAVHPDLVLAIPHSCFMESMAAVETVIARRKRFSRTLKRRSDKLSTEIYSQGATDDAFDVLHFIAAKRLTRGHLTVIDATNVQEESRKSLLRLAKEHDAAGTVIPRSDSDEGPPLGDSFSPSRGPSGRYRSRRDDTRHLR